MNMKEKFYFNYWLTDLLREDIFKDENEEQITVSFTSTYTQEKDEHKEDVIMEIMIFLEKEDHKFKVRIYKSNPKHKYIPHCLDQVTKYTLTDEYDDFYFENFENAKTFIIFLVYFHIEYRKRPINELKRILIK